MADTLEEPSSGGMDVWSDRHWEAVPEIPPLVARLRLSESAARLAPTPRFARTPT